jgi:hypothetical protein
MLALLLGVIVVLVIAAAAGAFFFVRWRKRQTARQKSGLWSDFVSKLVRPSLPLLSEAEKGKLFPNYI